MSASRHASDAHQEAGRLHAAIQDLCARNLLGENISGEELNKLLLSGACVRYHTARAMHAVGLFNAAERRARDAVISAAATPVTAEALA